MPLTSYVVRCYRPGCPEPAVYKVAARWSDGITRELKTYSLCCAGCLAHEYRRATSRWAECRTAPGETLERPGIYLLARGSRDRQLTPMPELEAELGG
jgi:hypothetical protein